ncbi:MAG: hypothetical protein JWN72_1905, partial [Thermoleophilia bacterium]|nr:hypothetical protein [Thermoleophilia bacterium]
KGVLEEGLPPGFVERMTEFRVGRALCFMIPAREDLITLKLDAASSNLAERAKHVSDLHDLAPTPAEWEAALRHVEARFISPADAAVRDARTIRADIEGTS